MACQITTVSIVCSTVCSGADQRKHQSSPSLAFVRGIHRWPVDSPHKEPITRKMLPFDDVNMNVIGACFISSNADLCWVFLVPSNLKEEVIIIAADLQLAQDGDNVKVYDGNDNQSRRRLHSNRSRFNIRSFNIVDSIPVVCLIRIIVQFHRITMVSYWAWLRLKSPPSRLFTKPFIQA